MRLPTAIIVSMFLLACSRSAPTPSTTSPLTLISTAGKYALTRTNLTLTISITPDQLVDYQLIDSSGTKFLQSTERASNNARWFLLFDDHSRLWFYSGDVGTYVWTPDAEHRYSHQSLHSHPELQKEMPPAFLNALPANARKDR